MRLEDIGNKKYLGKGRCATCYVLDDGNVFKQFNYPVNTIFINRFKYFEDYETDSIIFPFEYVYDEEGFHGYISKRAFGDILQKEFVKSDLLKLSTNSIKLENDIKYISNGKIRMFDFHDENILYDGNKLSVIDSDGYNINDFFTVKEIEKENLQRYKNIICNLFIENINDVKIQKKLKEIINKYRNINVLSSTIIILIKEEIEKFYKENINSLDDIKKFR